MSYSSPEGIILGKGSQLISAKLSINQEEVLRIPPLQQSEAIVKDFRIIEDCLGAQKTKTDVMISFTKLQEKFDYFDLFFTREQIIELRNDLNHLIDAEFCAKLK